MHEIKYIVIHCTETISMTSAESLLKSWKTVSGKKNPGYDYLIDNRGGIYPLIFQKPIANDVPDYYSKSIHVAYIGGVDMYNIPKDTRSAKQQISMFYLIFYLKHQYPKAIIQGHRDFPNVSTFSPSFDAKALYKGIK